VFARENRTVSLTPLGEAILPAVSDSLTALHKVLDSARQTGSSSSLRISTTPEFGTQWLTPRLQSFLDANRNIRVSVSLEYRRADLDNGEADVAIWLGGGGTAFQAERLMLEEEFAVSSPELRDRLPKRKALLAAPLLRYEGARHTVLDWRRWHSQLYGAEEGSIGHDLMKELDFDAGQSYPTFAEMLEACRLGKGFALVRTSLVADDIAAGRLVRCFVETMPSDLHYHLVLPRLRRPRPEVSAFRQWILSEARAE
jgi:LysR family transcriptional regulator, glycine cleavage system transcriptional activator